MDSTLKEIQFVTPKNKYTIFYYNIPVSFGSPLYLAGYHKKEHSMITEPQTTQIHKRIKDYKQERKQMNGKNYTSADG
jgi:hypothetical protein